VTSNMKVKMSCDVEPKIKVGHLKGIYGDWEYSFIPNEEGNLAKIIIEAIVPDYTKYKIWSSPVPEDPEHNILHIDMDHEFNEILVEEFQYFEGMLSLLGSPVRVSWHAPYIESIPEKPEEEPHKIAGFQMEKKREEPIVEISDNNIGNMIIRAHGHSQIINPYLTFYREAVSEYNTFRYINSFFNSYFVLEGAYGNDKWRNWEVREEFIHSDEFKKITQDVIDNYIKKDRQIEDKIVAMLNGLTDARGNPVHASLNIEGIAYLTVDTRGALHHFSSDPAKRRGSPYNHEEFKELASITLQIARGTIWELSKEVDDYMEKLKEEMKEEE
jgi:hypothetical protein